MNRRIARRNFMGLTGAASLTLIGSGGLSMASATPAQAADTADDNLVISGLTMTQDTHYATAGGADLRFDFYQGTVKPADAGMEVPATPPTTPTPIVVWVPPHGIQEYAPGGNHTNVDSKFPTPIAGYLGHGYAVVSMSYASHASRNKDLKLLIAYLKQHADELVIDTDNIGVLTATTGGHTASVATADVPDLTVQAPRDTDYQALITADNTKRIVEYFASHIGGAYDTDYDPLSMATPDVAWVDPCVHTSELGEYHVFPSPSRGRGTYASYALYLPDAYQRTPRKRFPVIYFLHGGNGNQREAGNWLMVQVDRLIKAGTLPPTIVVCAQGLPIGWYVNAREEADGVLSGPVEDVLVKDLVPHIDATYRTVASREGRGIEGWSAGGFGALRSAFKFPETFGYVSSLAGAVIDFEDEPMKQYVTNTFGPLDDPASAAYFNRVRPHYFVEHNTRAIKAKGVKVRLLVGDGDWLYDKDGKKITENFSDLLTRYGIKHTYTVLPGVDHMITEAIAAGTLAYPSDFWAEALAKFK
ncbi:alpha/beta hydrolase-fold protein [Streptomyces sp. NPDC001663]|uniref:alpha/beta hydrolase-fold protein n=1 Tax=Streptomyces sp. NPDC001663 TaxID=3364597 RepID=UPI00368A825D